MNNKRGVSASNVARANPPLRATKSTGIAAGTQSASAWSAAETTGSIEIRRSVRRSRIAPARQKMRESEENPLKPFNAAAVPPVVGSGLAVQAVMPLPMSAPPAQSILSEGAWSP